MVFLQQLFYWLTTYFSLLLIGVKVGLSLHNNPRRSGFKSDFILYRVPPQTQKQSNTHVRTL